MISSKAPGRPSDAFALMNCRRLPARLNTSEAALLLGVHDHDIPVLVGARLLDPLGKPAPNAPKYFAAVDVMAAAENRDWLAKATATIAKHWREKNGRKQHRHNRATARFVAAG